MTKSILKKLLLTAMATLAMNAYAESWLVVTGPSGEQWRFAIAATPKISYEAGGLVVKGEGQEVAFSNNDIVKCVIIDSEAKTESVKVDAPLYKIAGDILTVKLLKAGERVSVYSADGALQATAEADREGTVSIALPATHGILIVKTDTLSFKILNKR